MKNKQILFNALDEVVRLNGFIRISERNEAAYKYVNEQQAKALKELKEQVDRNDKFTEEMVGLMRSVREEHVLNPAAIKLKLTEILKRYGRE